MRKTTKGAIAIGAGVALLLGGAGTLAYWSDSKPLSSGTTITSGKLTVATKTAGSWAWANGTTTPAFVPGTSKVVPGDSIRYTEVFTVTALGNRLNAQSSYAVPTYSGTNALTTALGTPAVTLTAVKTGAGTGTITTGTNSFSISSPTTETTFDVTVTVTLTFDSATAGVSAQDLSAVLQNGAVTISQV